MFCLQKQIRGNNWYVFCAEIGGIRGGRLWIIS